MQGRRVAPAAWAANALLLGVLAAFGALAALSPDLHYRLAQEDEALEWASFWCFALAAVGFGVAALESRRRSPRAVWFLAGLALFAAAVAAEEISWGQRLAGYRPPEFFLERNYQQELNFHNVISTRLRTLALQGVLLGWGVLLPLAAQTALGRASLERLGLRAPPLALAVGMGAAWALYAIYPWDLTGEIVELALGLGLLLAALAQLASARARGALAWNARSVLLAGALVAGLGVASALLSQRFAPGDTPEATAAARREVAALREDLLALPRRHNQRPPTDCGLHRRLYTFVDLHRQPRLREGAFARLVQRGLPEARARYFLDPWNDPYWLRHECSDDRRRRILFVYSFGPNRRRDSSDWELRGDDVGMVVSSQGLSD